MNFKNIIPDDKGFYEIVGRTVTNALGHEEIVELERIYWDYLDFLRSEKLDIDGYIKRCDLHRGSTPFAAALAWWTYWEFEDREREGKPRPAWLQPFEPI